MTEAFGRVIEFSFMELKLNRINIAAFAENEGSNTLIHNAKFEPDRTLKQHVRDKATGSLHDENIYYLLRDRYMSGKRSKG
jgi:RimJ/RimL family protein N-acetyltransferase